MKSQNTGHSLIDNQGKGRFVRVEDVAQILGVSPKTVRGWVYTGKIPSRKINGARRFDMVEIEGWLSEQEN